MYRSVLSGLQFYVFVFVCLFVFFNFVLAFVCLFSPTNRLSGGRMVLKRRLGEKQFGRRSGVYVYFAATKMGE